MSRVVPELDQGRPTNEKVEEFRQSVLTLWIWRTTVGTRFLRWFWKSRIGVWLTRKFGDAEAAELHGYAYWGPVAALITVVEILGAASKRFENAIPWPTISGTVGHIQDLNSLWGLLVVALIAAAAFYAVSYPGEAAAPGREPFLGIGPINIRYGWPLVYALTLLIGVGTWLFLSHEKYHLGYAIYGSFALFGLVLPMFLVWRGRDFVVFPNLFYTFGRLRARFRWVAMAVIAGLAILVLHLALYPWPNLAREPATYAGLNAFHARTKAERALRDHSRSKDGLVYSAQGRGVARGRSVWLVYFTGSTDPVPREAVCIVEVTSKQAIVDNECLE